MSTNVADMVPDVRCAISIILKERHTNHVINSGVASSCSLHVLMRLLVFYCVP